MSRNVKTEASGWTRKDWTTFVIRCLFLGLALAWLFTTAEFEAVRAVYEAY